MTQKQGGRIAGFDGLRAIAIIGIVLYHLFPDQVPGGFLGVPLFFSIMGYLLVYSSWNELRYGDFNLLTYYAKKIRRLYPPLIIMLLMTGLFKSEKKDGAGRRVMQTMMNSLKIPKAVYFTAVLLLESARRLSVSPAKGKSRFIYNRDFLDALDYNRIVARAEKRSEDTLNAWADLYDEKGQNE
jgi:hypothetical protein